MTTLAEALPRRWTKMYLNRKQRRYYQSKARFNVVPPGRRSGKTELAKRRLIKRALRQRRYDDARYAACAPTRDQAKDIYWEDLKRMIPPQFIAPNGISESKLSIRLITNTVIQVIGMGRPARIEGSPLSGVILDEYGNMRPEAWMAHVRPALTDRLGWADFVGVPEGRNHYYDLYVEANRNKSGEWAVHEWTTMEVLPLYLGHNVDPEAVPDDLRHLLDDPKALGLELSDREISAAMHDLDSLTFDQEYRGSFVTFEGRAYYEFTRAEHTEPVAQYYDPKKPIGLCFDFNVRPGCCEIIQDMEYKGRNPNVADEITAVIGEVYFPRNSNTKRICNAIKRGKFGKHKGEVFLYGDATGGAKHTSQTEGSDWEIIDTMLFPVYGKRLINMVPEGNPPERYRVNSHNARIKAADGTINMLVDSEDAPFLIKDYEGVTCGPDGAIEKDKDSMLTHPSDAVGYWAHTEHPLSGEMGFELETY